VGEEFDGALPDPYSGIEPMLELFAAKSRLNDEDRPGPVLEKP
jgi:hypothetical protein